MKFFLFVFLNFILFLFVEGCSSREPEDISFNEPLLESQDLELVWIEGGWFTRGNSWDTLYHDNQNDEFFTRFIYQNGQFIEVIQYDDTVWIDGFWIGRYEVTNRAFNRFVEAGGYQDSTLWSVDGRRFIDSLDITLPYYWQQGENLPWHEAAYSYSEDRPVMGISFYEAEAFCQWLSQEWGAEVRLPTEAEWEKAARWADPAPENHSGHRYPWGDTLELARMNGYEWSDGFVNTAPVHAFSAGQSAYGIYQMLGNVWEWCGDWYRADYYKEAFQRKLKNPTGPAAPLPERIKVVRGGDFGPCFSSSYRNSNRHGFPVTHRGHFQAMDKNDAVGFRIAMRQLPQRQR